MSKKPIIFIIIFLTFILLVGLACSFSKKGDPTATPEAPAIEVPQVEPTTKMPIEEPVNPVPGTSEGGLTLLPGFKFFQDESTLTSVVFFRNDNSSKTLVDVEYTVHAYNASDAQVDKTESTIGYLAPGETLGLVDEIWLDEGVIVDRISVDWIIGDEVTDEVNTSISVKNAKYFMESDWRYLTGVLVNNDKATYTSLRVSGIAFDTSGEIVGGGYTYIDFLPGNDQVGVSILSSSFTNADRIELYPLRLSYGDVFEGGDWWNNIEVVKFGFVLNGDEVGGGAIVKNVTDRLIEDTQFYLTIYDKDGYVCGVDSGFVDYVWPGVELGFSPGATYVRESCDPDNVDLIVMPGEFSEHELTGEPLVSDSAVFNYSDYWSTVTVTLRNTLNKSITDAYVSVLLMDADGKIIGGGSGWPEDFGPLGTQELEIFVTYARSEDPANIMVYPVISTWSDIGE